MIPPKSAAGYWFVLEPYVYVNITKRSVLLYNTLDGVFFESKDPEIIELIHEILQEDNCGVTLLTHERYKNGIVKNFIDEIRNRYMGDIIDVVLSKGKPVQLLPMFNFSPSSDIYKKQSFHEGGNVSGCLFELKIHVDRATDLTMLISFLQLLSGKPTFHIVGNIWETENYCDLLTYFDNLDAPKNISCSYDLVRFLPSSLTNDFAYKISVDFPTDTQQWNNSIQVLLEQRWPVEYIFNVSSKEDCQQAAQIIEQFHIESYLLNPVFTGCNISFFEENVFLAKDDILSASISMKDIFSRQTINTHDFGKINVMPNGDVYANVNHPVLGNIATHSIHELLYKEINEGKSWFRIRDQAPCNTCLYQWMCPSPSDHEIAIGKPSLCHVKS